MVSGASLLADLANAQGQITRQAARVLQLEQQIVELRDQAEERDQGA